MTAIRSSNAPASGCFAACVFISYMLDMYIYNVICFVSYCAAMQVVLRAGAVVVVAAACYQSNELH